MSYYTRSILFCVCGIYATLNILNTLGDLFEVLLRAYTSYYTKVISRTKCTGWATYI